MQDDLSLALAVRRFVAAARRSPALAVGAGLDELDQIAEASIDAGGYVAQHAPIATDTWMSRVSLLTADDESEPDEVTVGEPARIVGFFPTLLLVENGKTLPPMEAIDVAIEFNKRRNITSKASSGQEAGTNAWFVNLPMISVLAPRLIGMRLSNADPRFSVSYRWAVDAATRAALGWGNVQVSLGAFMRLTEPD